MKRKPSAASKDAFAAELERAKRKNTAHLLLKCARLVNERAIATLPAALSDGFQARAAHMALFPHIDLGGTRQSALAERLGVTKQAVGPLVDDLEEAGIVERIPDPDDGRAKRVVFTEKGRQGMLAGLSHLQDIERSLAKAVGRDTMNSLRDALLVLQEHLEETSLP